MLSVDIFDNEYSEEPFFFFLLMVSCEVYLCFRSICSGNDLLGCAPSKVNWQTGMPILTHSRCQAAQLSHANLCLLLHCFPTCNQGFPSCLSLCCLSARSIR